MRFVSKSALLTGVAALAFGGGFAVPSAQASLVGLYQFNNSANLGLDSSGSGNNLITVGNAAYAASGEQGGGLSLSGGIMTTVSGMAPANFPLGGSSYTLSVDFETTNTSTMGLIGWGNYGTYDQTNAFRTVGGGGLDNYWWANDVQSTATTDNGQWHNATVTFNSVTDTRNVYLDGTLIASLDNGTTPNVQAGSFAIGQTCLCDNTFYGTLDNVAVFNQALTVAQVAVVATGNLQAFGVPEPASLALLGAGTAATGFMRRRSRT